MINGRWRTEAENTRNLDGRSWGGVANLLLPVITVGWLLAVAAGLYGLMEYANRTGDRGGVPSTWPDQDELVRVGRKPILLLFAHPKCPCTRATIDELGWIMRRCGDNVDCRVLFLQPEGKDPAWSRTDCWRSAEAIPGVQVLADRQCGTANLFGVRTSGHVLLYDSAGHLLFDGGITPARGHRGPNLGRQTIVSRVASYRGESSPSRLEKDNDQSVAATATTGVFGCPLFDDPPPTRMSKQSDHDCGES